MVLTDALVSAASRLTRDLRFAPRPLIVELRRDSSGYEWVLIDRGVESAGVGGPDEDLEELDVEHLTVDVAEALDNLWPDDLTAVWPACPVDGDHPLVPRLLRGRASWCCPRRHDVAVVIGELRPDSDR
jgi:hypothetical protein